MDYSLWTSNITFGLGQCALYSSTRLGLGKAPAHPKCSGKTCIKKSKYDSATQALKELHWLPIKFRIIHKLLTLVYKSLKGSAPKYLQELLQKQQPGRDGLRSGNDPTSTLKV